MRFEGRFGRHRPAGRHQLAGTVLARLVVVGLLSAVGLAATTSVAAAAGCDSWTGAGGNNLWDTNGNWSTNAPPTSSDNACITSAGTFTVVIGNETITVANLTVGGSGSTPTLQIGNGGSGFAHISVTGALTIAATGTVSHGFGGTFAAGSVTNAGTFQVPSTGFGAVITFGNVSNTGTFSVAGGATLALSPGTTFDNAGGTITNAASSALAISTSGTPAGTLQLDSGGVVNNSGTLTVADTLLVNGGSICGNALDVGSGDNGTGGSLKFPSTPGTGPACGTGVTTDHIFIFNVPATLSGTIPSAYTVAVGDGGSSEPAVALSGNVVNDGTFVPGFGATFSSASSSDFLTNSGTMTVPSSAFQTHLNFPIVNNGQVTFSGPANATLPTGESWSNTSTGTITVASGQTMAFGSPSGQSATLQLGSGGVVNNSGTLTVADTLLVNGGSICGNALDVGSGDNGTGGSLQFPSTPGTGPACGTGVTTDHIFIFNVPATLSGTIPSAYTVAVGDGGSSEPAVALSGNVVNDGTFAPGWGGTISSAASSDFLTNNGTVAVPSSAFTTHLNVPIVNDGQVTFNGSADSTLPTGESWSNTSTGTITVPSGQTMAFGSASGQAPSFIQAGVINNTGTFRVADPITINGGTICGTPLNLGAGDGSTGTFTLTFAANPPAGPACAKGVATDQVFIYNVTATIETNIAKAYTVAIGDGGSGLAHVSTPGALSNAGTLEPGFGATLTVNGTLTNTGTLLVPTSPFTTNLTTSSLVNTVGHVTMDGAAVLSGAYSQGSKGTFTAAINGTSVGSGYGQLTANGGSSLAGTLTIVTGSKFKPKAGQSYVILNGGAVTGTFSTVTGTLAMTSGTLYNVAYNASNVTLNVVNPPPPSNTALPVISGTTTVGQTLSTTNGTWSSPDTLKYKYAWQRCTSQTSGCVPITGATKSTYVLVAADVGSFITVIVTAKDQVHQGTSATATAVGPVGS